MLLSDQGLERMLVDWAVSLLATTAVWPYTDALQVVGNALMGRDTEALSRQSRMEILLPLSKGTRLLSGAIKVIDSSSLKSFSRINELNEIISLLTPS
jgi:hypothetical protein